MLGGLIEWCVLTNRVDLGRDIQNAAEKAGLPMTTTLGASLITLYSKTGRLEAATSVWNQMKTGRVLNATAAGRMVWLIATNYGVERAEAFYKGTGNE